MFHYRKENANEVIVECCIELDKLEDFNGPWNHDRFLKLFYYFRGVLLKTRQFKNPYFTEYIVKSHFERCISIIGSLGEIPSEIHEKICEDIYRYPHDDLKRFNRGPMIYLKLQEPFIRREIDRILLEWTQLENTGSLIVCT